MEDDYVLGALLGSGTFASVRRGLNKRTGQEVAIKTIPKTRQSAASIRHEISTLQRVSMHKNIAKLEAAYETEDCFYIVMELVSGGELFDHLVENGAFSEHEAGGLVRKLAEAIALLHAQGLCHADIKPENMLLTADGKDVKLVDFGLTCEFASREQDAERTDPNKHTKSIGTRAYWPPELFRGGKGPGLPMDLWALGVVLYILLNGTHPFDDGTVDDAALEHNICELQPEFGSWPASAESKQLVSSLLRKDPNERLTIEQLLQHPWLKSDDASALRSNSTGGSHSRQNDGGDGGGRMGRSTSRDVNGKLLPFRRLTAQLRCACFAILLQQQAAEIAPRKAAVYRKGSLRGDMLEADMLTKAFREFDIDGKGYITESDLQRVLQMLGRQPPDDEVHGMMKGAAGFDREGQRVTYGNYVRLMTHTVKQSLLEGDVVFREGDPVDYFYCLLKGKLEMVTTRPDGSEAIALTLQAGESFGESALLEGRTKRNSTMRCKTPVEILRLSKEDFEAGFLNKGVRRRSSQLGESSTTALTAQQQFDEDSVRESAEEEVLRSKLLGFIQMVSRTHVANLEQGEVVFRDGDPVDKFYILRSGRLQVDQPKLEYVDQLRAKADANRSYMGRFPGTESQEPVVEAKADSGVVKLGEIGPGQCFGESSLLEGKPKRTKNVTCATGHCEVVSVRATDFLRLVQKSRVVRQSFQALNNRRRSSNNVRAAIVAVLQEELDDPILRKYVNR